MAATPKMHLVDFYPSVTQGPRLHAISVGVWGYWGAHRALCGAEGSTLACCGSLALQTELLYAPI